MSAAATAAGYLYASGRLRGRNGKEGETQEPEQKKAKPKRKELKVAVYEPTQEAAAPPVTPRPKSAPKIQYRTRRWKPE
jgi:NaMN:DMB phosphoribosyltransferase